MLSKRYPNDTQLTMLSHFLTAGPKDPNYIDWRDTLSMINTVLTMVQQYAEVCR